MKQGNVGLIAATYTSDAVDCGPEGDCPGRTAIEEHMKEEMANRGKAESASVTSIGSVHQGRFVYEWGRAEASFSNGKKVRKQTLSSFSATSLWLEIATFVLMLGIQHHSPSSSKQLLPIARAV